MVMFYSLVIVLIMLGILFLALTKSNPNQQNLQTLSIIQDNVCDYNVEKYCSTWGYSYNSLADCLLYINDNITFVDTNQSLTDLLTIISNKEYISFYGCNDYIIKTNSKITKKDIINEVTTIDIPNLSLLEILYQGYPYLTKNGIILHRAYIDKVFRDHNLSFKLPTIIPTYIPRRHNVGRPKIPQVLYQTHYSRLLSDECSKSIYSWLDHNHEYDYCYFDDRDCRQFIKDNFDITVLQAYDKVIPAAYKADLWRYCVIYINGGVYANINTEPNLALQNIIRPKDELVIINGYNGFFAAIPKHPGIMKTINLVVGRIMRNEYGPNYNYPTGSLAMMEALRFEQAQVVNRDVISIVENNSIMDSLVPKYDQLWNEKAIYHKCLTADLTIS